MITKHILRKISRPLLLLSFATFWLAPHQGLAQVRKTKVKKKVVRVESKRRIVTVPRRGVTVKVAPTNARIVTFRNVPYRYHAGVFYKPYGNQFTVVAPPIGIRISILPTGHRSLLVGGRRYFYYHGIYYSQAGNEYEVVSAPVGALVESIPDGYEEILIEGDTYYLVEGVQYKAVLHQGEIWYEVIKVG